MANFKFVDETVNSPAVSLDAALVVVPVVAPQIRTTKAVPKAPHSKGYASKGSVF